MAKQITPFAYGTEEGVRTREAKRLIRKSLTQARRVGHRPALISKSGYMELYGCMNVECTMTIDCWDTPEICNGPLSRAFCRSPEAVRGNRRFFTAIADKSRRMINIFSWFLGLIRRFFK